MNNIRKTIEEDITDDGATPDGDDAGGGRGNNGCKNDDGE